MKFIGKELANLGHPISNIMLVIIVKEFGFCNRPLLNFDQIVILKDTSILK
jgi:hypothetical protein